MVGGCQGLTYDVGWFSVVGVENGTQGLGKIMRVLDGFVSVVGIEGYLQQAAARQLLVDLRAEGRPEVEVGRLFHQAAELLGWAFAADTAGDRVVAAGADGNVNRRLPCGAAVPAAGGGPDGADGSEPATEG